MWTNKAKACLILIFNTNTNSENMAYRPFRSEKYAARESGGQHCLASMGSDLEAFSRNPTDDCFVVLVFQVATLTKNLNKKFVLYCLRLLSQHQVHQ